MNWSSFKYLARQGLQSMVRNRLMSVASIGVLTVCLIITGVAALFTLNINSLMDYLGSQNEAVVYLQDDLSDEGLAQVDGALRSISGLRDVIYVTKQEALDNMKESMEDKAYLWDAFEGSDNPFSATYRVILDDVAMMPEIEPQLTAIPGVEEVMAPVQMAELFTSIHKAVTLVSVILVTVASVATGREDAVIFRRKIDKKTVYRALSIAVLSLFAVILATLFVFFNTGANCGPLDSLFESVSAFATVGLSVGATANMEPLAKAITMVTMFVGRVGPVSLAISLAAPRKEGRFDVLPEGKISVG